MNVGLAQQKVEWQRLKRSGGWPVNERKEGKGGRMGPIQRAGEIRRKFDGGPSFEGLQAYSGKKRSNQD